MSLILENPQQAVANVVHFLQQVFENQHKKHGVIAVSGGIDSAVSLTLLTQALGAENITAVILPYADQPIDDNQVMVQFNRLPATNVQSINIQSMVDAAAETLQVSNTDVVRFGNLKARARMIAVYDTAKRLDALVCGTENKSEHYLGYFTRFGDAASDIESIAHWYKTQIRQVASTLNIPEPIITKPPSAGLWSGQTDEEEMGFTYEVADQVLYHLIDMHESPDTIAIEGVEQSVIEKVVKQVQSQAFKLAVPYQL